MSNIDKVQGRSETSEREGNIDLIDLVIIVAKNKKSILVFTFVSMCIAAGVALLLPNMYTARAQVLPPQSQTSSAALLGQLGSLSGLAGGSLKSPNDTYVGILNSRTVADNLISRYKLDAVYGNKFLSDVRNNLQSATKISSGKENLISIEVTDADPKLAAALANGYVEELQKMTSVLAVTEASKRRLFFEKQLQNTKQDLTSAEEALRKIQEKTGLIKLNEQAEAVIKVAANIKAAIAAKEIELSVMRTSVTTSNPEFIHRQQELAGLRAQLKKVETGANAGNGDISVAVTAVPELGLEFTRSLREVKYQEALFEMFAKQFEFAKVDEAKEGSLLQVLDNAIVPDTKSKPRRSIIVLLTGVAAAALAIFWAFWIEVRNNLKSNPDTAMRIEKLKRYSRWK
jgi:tyrosine-protein kinase Etk/Wzc